MKNNQNGQNGQIKKANETTGSRGPSAQGTVGAGGAGRTNSSSSGPQAQQGLPDLSKLMQTVMNSMQGQGDLNPKNASNIIDQMVNNIDMAPDMKNQIKSLSSNMFEMLNNNMNTGGPMDAGGPPKVGSTGPSVQINQSVPEGSLREPENRKSYEVLDDEDDSDFDEFRPRTKDMEIQLNVSLEELYAGAKKKLTITRKRIAKDKIVEEKKKIVVPIVPGMVDKQQIRYNKQADETFGYDTGDIVVTLKENAHSEFERNRYDLYTVKKISIFESYAAASGLITLTIRTLDNRFLKLNANSVPLHAQDGIRKIKGEGMPFYNKEGRGDLYVRFNVVLPERLLDINSLKTLFPPILDEILYNDGSKNKFDITGRKVKDVSLDILQEEDIEKLDYQEDSDNEDSSSSESSESKESHSRSFSR